jgi:hypothetical protein
MRVPLAICVLFPCLALALASPPPGRAQAALLLEDAGGRAAIFSPVGHESVYFARICAASLTKLRRCGPGESGVVISRYRGIAGFDWLAIPVIPYLWSVEKVSEVPAHVDRETVQRLRTAYHSANLMSLGDMPESWRLHPGWDQLVGAAYDRRIYAFRFETTPQQDDAFIARMNAGANRSHFNILFRNCANFSAGVLDFYFPGAFRRRIVPDGGLVTPRQVAFALVRYARRHPDVGLPVEEIPQVPGFHRRNRMGMTAAESLIVTGYVVPIAFLSPYAGGVIVADYLIWGRDPLPVKKAEVLTPDSLALLKDGKDEAGNGSQTTAFVRSSPGP